jgi:hypothetical protein
MVSGTLRRVHPGVYRVGHAATSPEASYLAAVRACGEGAELSGPAAGWLWGLLRCAPPRPEVTAPKDRQVRGVVTRRRSLDPRDVTIHRGVPVTTVARTLVDLAAFLPSSDLARACHEAGVKHKTTPRQVKEAIGRHPNAKGVAKLRRIMDGDEKVSLSRLESRFLAHLRARGLPLPETNRPASGRRVDCRWAEHKLTVELDSYTFHNSRYSWEGGYARQREARARGEQFRRYSRDDVYVYFEAMLDELEGLLRGGWGGSRRVAGRAVEGG